MAKTVLVAEDEPYILESLKFLLSRAGYAVRSERDGQSTVEAVIGDPPDLIVLDVMMPRLNGFEALKRIRQTRGLKDLPVLVLTAKGQEDDRRRMLDLGATDLVTKPFSNRDLLARIAQLIGEAGSDPNGGVAVSGSDNGAAA